MPVYNQNCLIFFSSSTQPCLMAPAAGVSEALTAALCRVASALCQAACVVNRRLGSCRGAKRGLLVKAEAPFRFK